MEDFNNNIIEVEPEPNGFVKRRKYSYVALGLGTLSLVLSLICFVKYIFDVLSIVSGIAAFVFAIMGMSSDKKGRGFFGSILAIIGIVISIFLITVSLKDLQEVSRQARKISEAADIYLVDKRPAKDTYNIDVEKQIMQGSYLYDYSLEERMVFLENINYKWTQGEIDNELKLYLEYFTMIPQEFFEEDGYFVYYNIDKGNQLFDNEALYYNFVFIYFDKENKYEHDLYLYTFEKYQDFQGELEEDIIEEQ